MTARSAGGFPAGVVCVQADLCAPLHVIAHRIARAVDAAAIPPLIECAPAPLMKA